MVGGASGAPEYGSSSRTQPSHAPHITQENGNPMSTHTLFIGALSKISKIAKSWKHNVLQSINGNPKHGITYTINFT